MLEMNRRKSKTTLPKILTNNKFLKQKISSNQFYNTQQ